jgi:hypothetical protein
VLFGTFLATHGGAFQFSALDLVAGQLINTDALIQFVSNSKISAPAPFVPPTQAVPEPTTLSLVGSGLVSLGMVYLTRRRRKR